MRFLLGLWAAKFAMFVYRLRGIERTDRPGTLAYRFDHKMLKHLKKPPLTIVVTGTNGKTSVSTLVNQVLTKTGLKTSFNDWGANTRSGDIRCLLDAVTIFNKSRKDAVVIEMDEMTSPENLPNINPDYLLINNISRDSIRRNAYPKFILDKLTEAVNKCPNTILILNADDPISSFIECPNKKIFYSIDSNDNENVDYCSNDFLVCPNCYNKPKYLYRHYRHIGKFTCQKCGLKSFDGDYIVKKINYKNSELLVSYNNKKVVYPLVSKSIFNAFNTLAVITLFKTLGYNDKVLKEALNEAKIPESRENSDIINGIEIKMQMAKGQNVSATSTVFKHLGELKDNMIILMNLDEVPCVKDNTETVTWLYETDFEFLNRPNIKKIIVASKKHLDYKVRILLAGIKENKMICIEDPNELVNYVQLDGIEKIYILHEVDAVSSTKRIRDSIKEKIRLEMIK